jgi:hypothetical protein
MGFKVGKNVPPMERELIYLLADLYVNWGFCIPPENLHVISKKEYYQAIEFAQDVVKAEGMDSNSDWINRIAERFRERFETDKIVLQLL